MTQKIYRTARGKQIDMGALAMKNQNTRAVSNMSVNARGDIIDSHNNVVDPLNRRTARHYDRGTNVTAGPVGNDSARQARQPVTTDIETVITPTVVAEQPTDPVAPEIDPVAETESQTPTKPSRLADSITASAKK
jgi:hypothetical protein